MRIYCDGIFDLLHKGHLAHLNKLATIEPGVQLIVGVVGDDDSTAYKRRPVWTLEQRTALVASLSCVCEVVSPCPMAIDADFIRNNNIDAVYHAFASTEDLEKQSTMHAVPMQLGIFHTIPYNHGVSTTERINSNGWDGIWQRKGVEQSADDVRLLTGYDSSDNFDPALYADAWKKIVRWQGDETVLDVGCGAGFLGDFLPSTRYVGVEQAQSLADAFINRSQRTVLVHDAESLPFKDNAFDHVVSHSVMQYLPSKASAVSAIKEMQRVARKSVFLGDLRSAGHAKILGKHVFEGTTTHTLFQRSDFTDGTLDGFVTSNGLWGPDSRFNAVSIKDECLHAVINGAGPAVCE